MKKALLIGCPIAFVLGVGAIVGFVYLILWATSGATDATDQFLALVAAGKYTEAYESTASTLQDQQDEETFTKAVQYYGLDDYASASWPSRSVNNNQAALEGTISTKSGGSIPVKVQLLKEGGEWKVLSINVPSAGANVDSSQQQIPADDELRALTTRTMLEFNDALLTQDFTQFYDSIAVLWQLQTKPEELQELFQVLIDEGVDFSAIKGVDPIFTQPPAFNSDGLLVLTGYYPTQPMQCVFELKYAYEHPEWKLVGIHVKAQEPPGDQPAGGQMP